MRARWDEADSQANTCPPSSSCTDTINYHINDSVQSLTPFSQAAQEAGALLFAAASPSLLHALRHVLICAGKLLLWVPKYQFSHPALF